MQQVRLEKYIPKIYSPYFKVSLPFLTICRIIGNFWNSPSLEIGKV